MALIPDKNVDYVLKMSILYILHASHLVQKQLLPLDQIFYQKRPFSIIIISYYEISNLELMT